MFRFTIRELVLLTLVVAMGVGWWVDRTGLTVEVSRLRRLTVAPSWLVREVDKLNQHWAELVMREEAIGLKPSPPPLP